MIHFLLVLALALGCARRTPGPSDDANPPVLDKPAPSAELGSAPVRTVDVPVPGDLTAYVIRGSGARRVPMLFLPGMCVHPAGYVMSFQQAVASRGDLVAVQGDLSCGGDGSMRRWSNDLDAMDRRIDAAFNAAGLGEPRGVLVIGYSQGAERAEKLVAKFSRKYASVILIASPVPPSTRLLMRADAVGLMAGTFDGAKGTHSAAVPALRRAGIPASFLELPGAHHGQMGERPDDSMREMFDFIEANGRSKNSPIPPSHKAAPAAR